MSESHSVEQQVEQEVLENHENEQTVRELETVSILPLRNTVVFPSNVLPLLVERPGSIQLIDDALAQDRVRLWLRSRTPTSGP